MFYSFKQIYTKKNGIILQLINHSKIIFEQKNNQFLVFLLIE
jgi:hypothetical protein